MIIADLHVHSYNSKDSLLKPRDIITTAVKKGINCVAVTDHNTVKGGLELVREARELKDFIAIPGVEVKTDVGDVILLFVDEEIKIERFDELLDYAKSVNAITILAHPYRKHVMVEESARKVQVIEVLNSRSFKSANLKALSLASKLNKPIMAGSDAHTASEIGRAVTIIEGSSEDDIRGRLLKGEVRIFGSESNPLVHLLSFANRIINEVIEVFGGS
ncbi:MAG: PHP domain-containing protein [Candidatus Nezhaarchaeota archaeon]|nr:PHP domain-containing protein [Candidatus Nezhaarchaeota archaeon]